MASIKSMLAYALLLVLAGPCPCAPSNEQNQEAHVDRDAFQQLLAQVDPPALHAALHDFSPKKFKHGMFPEDKTAVEVIHKEQPGLATGILKMAKLSRRQVGNGTLTTSAPVSEEPATTRVTPVPQGPETSSTTGEASPQTTLTSETSSAAANSPTPTPTSSPSLTAGEVVTTTDAEGRTIISTIGGGATTLTPSGSLSSAGRAQGQSSLTSTLLQTSTLPNGEQSTITAVTVVGGATDGAETPTGTAGAPPGGTSSGSPGLQTNEAQMSRGCGKEMVAVLGAAVGFAVML